MNSPHPPHQRLPKEIREEQILKAALSCFSSKGYHAASVSDIVAAAGISKGNLYWHFKGKEDIFLAVLDRFVAEALLEIDRDILLPKQTLDEMRDRMIEKITDRIVRDRPFMVAWLEFVAVGSRDENVRSRLIDIPEKFRNSLKAYFGQMLKKGEIRPMDPGILATLFLTVFDGIMMRGVIWHEAFARRETISEILTMLVDFIRPTGKTRAAGRKGALNNE